MRFVDYETILEQMAVVFETKVLPALTDIEARQQTWAAIGLLDNLASRIGDQDQRLDREIELLEALIAEAPAGVIAERDELPAAQLPARPRRMALADLLSQVLSELAGAGEPTPEVLAWLDRCGDLLLELEAAELKRMRATRYYQSMRG